MEQGREKMIEQMEEMSKDIKDLVDALESMYNQYCDDGHSFMSAGEGASSVLEKYGYQFDGGGRITKRPTHY